MHQMRTMWTATAVNCPRPHALLELGAFNQRFSFRHIEGE
jgi:hypothetical protein